MAFSNADFFVIPTFWPPILAHSWKMYRERGFLGFWKDLSISVVIPVTGSAVTGAALGIISNIFPSVDLREVSEHWVLPGYIGIMGVSTVIAHRIYHRSSSWMIKTLIMHLHGGAMLFSIPLTSHLHARRARPLDSKKFEDQKIISNVIAGLFALIVSTTMICLSANPIWSSAAGSITFVTISIGVFSIFTVRLSPEKKKKSLDKET